MTERERLAEKISEYILIRARNPNDERSFCEGLADYLLDHGVIASPCKVGGTVYYLGGLYNSLIRSATVEEIIANSNGVSDLLVNSENGVTFENSIDIFYFTREEAEAALAERRRTQ